MAVSAKLYSRFPLNLLGANLVDMDSETKIMCMLCTSSYTPNQDTHNDKADITNEVSGTGYTTGGKALTTTAITVSGRVTKYDAVDVVWTSSTITARYAILYDDNEGAEANQPLIGYVDFGANVISDSGAFTIQWHASGIFTITVAA